MNQRMSIARVSAATLVSMAFAAAHAAPVANTAVFNDQIAEPGSIVFNVHDAGLVGGTPAPIYLTTNFDTSNAPPSVTAQRVGNACVEVRWGADNSAGEPWTIDYSLIAGDRSVSIPGTISFESGTSNLTPVTDIANGCGDPTNNPPQTVPTERTFQGPLRQVIVPLISSDGPASDPDGAETLRFTDPVCWTQPRNGTVAFSIEFPDSLIYTPDQGSPGGSDTFEYCVTDNPLGATDGVRGTATVTFDSVIPTLDAIDDTATTGQLETVFIDVLANDTGISGAFITAVGTPTGGGFAIERNQSECAVQIAGILTGCIEYTPPSSGTDGGPFAGDDTFTYTVANEGNQSDTATVTVTVLDTTPVVTDDTATTPSETAIVIDVRANDMIATGETINFVGTPSAGGSATVLGAAACAQVLGTGVSECIEYTPPVTATGEMPFAGVDTFEYDVSNGSSSSTATVSVTVEAAQTPTRQLMDDAVTTEPGQALLVDVFGNDSLESDDTLLSVTQGANGGSVEIVNAEGCDAFNSDFFRRCVRYTPPATTTDGVVFIGDDSFTYTAGVNATDQQTATVTVSVVAPDGTPQPVADDQEEVQAGDSVVIDVLTNDSDDGGAQNLTIVSVTDPANGTATINSAIEGADTITYTPDTGFVGVDTFFYTVSDGDVNTVDQAAQVTVTVSSDTQRVTLASLPLTPEEREIAGAIDTVCQRLNDSFGGDGEAPIPVEGSFAGQMMLMERCNALIDSIDTSETGNLGQIRDALRQIGGEEVFAQSTISTQILNTQTKNIDARLAALRGGARGTSASGLAVAVQGKALPMQLLTNRATPENENALLADSRLGLFINGRVNFGDQSATATENGFDFDTLGVTAGIDYRFTNNFVLGAAIGFANADVDYAGTSGELDADSLTYNLYATYYTDRLYVDMLAGWGGIDYDSARTLNFADAAGGVDTTALGTTEGDQRVFSANFGYNIDRNGWLFVPFLGYDYIDTNIDAFSEREGQGWELAFDEQKVQSQIVSAGVRMSYTHSTDFGVIVPHLRVAVQSELEDDLRVISARFVNDPGATRFRFFTDAPDSSFFQLATGISMVMPNGFSAFVDYETLTGYNNLTSDTLSLGVRFERRFR